ncbi:MAG: helix-turn-helix domain-containing protein [Dehalococcoidia bacterium]|jgi:hypothetical protein|nr:helix-turn-helix domain-containing protein [Dehalococcoidia bacterium]
MTTGSEHVTHGKNAWWLFGPGLWAGELPEECEQHYQVWKRALEEWIQRKETGRLDAEAQRTLISEVAQSLPMQGIGEVRVVSATFLGIARQLLDSPNERNAFLDYVQHGWATSAVNESLSEAGLKLWVEVDRDTEEEVEGDDQHRHFAAFGHEIATPPEGDEMLTVKQACAELGITVPAFHNHVQRKRGTPGAVPVIKLRGRYMLYRREFEAWKRAHYSPEFAPKRRPGRPRKK